jgi:hypothetical protein
MLKKIFSELFPKNTKTIGIFYICTGKYNIFWERFYHSSEQYFCPGMKKHYFIFTDSEINPKGANITIIEQKKLGWPFDTLMRFHMFNRIKEQALTCDYLFFFNANMVFLKKVTAKQILPNEQEELIGVKHPFYYGGTDGAPFETNELSHAYTDFNKAKSYIAGGLSGGLAKSYMDMAEEIAHNIDEDQKNGIIAVWHDESHINAYFSKHHHFKIIDPGYIVPESRLKTFPFKPYLVVLDKEKVGGHELLRS